MGLRDAVTTILDLAENRGIEIEGSSLTDNAKERLREQVDFTERPESLFVLLTHADYLKTTARGVSHVRSAVPYDNQLQEELLKTACVNMVPSELFARFTLMIGSVPDPQEVCDIAEEVVEKDTPKRDLAKALRDMGSDVYRILGSDPSSGFDAKELNRSLRQTASEWRERLDTDERLEDYEADAVEVVRMHIAEPLGIDTG